MSQVWEPHILTRGLFLSLEFKCVHWIKLKISYGFMYSLHATTIACILQLSYSHTIPYVHNVRDLHVLQSQHLEPVTVNVCK
jgi:hypothetical protein